MERQEGGLRAASFGRGRTVMDIFSLRLGSFGLGTWRRKDPVVLRSREEGNCKKEGKHEEGEHEGKEGWGAKG